MRRLRQQPRFQDSSAIDICFGKSPQHPDNVREEGKEDETIKPLVLETELIQSPQYQEIVRETR